MDLHSPRLSYTRLAKAHELKFHSLVIDSHIKAYLFDGQTKSPEWTRQAIEDSQRLFQEKNIGLWLIRLPETDGFVGFCGFRIYPEYPPDPEFLYAFLKSASGKGYATECARALIDYAKNVAKLSRLQAKVDEPNIESKKVLEKVGFQFTGTIPGAFGKILTYEQ